MVCGLTNVICAEVRAKIAATKAALSPEREQEIGQKISKGRLTNPKIMSIGECHSSQT